MTQDPSTPGTPHLSDWSSLKFLLRKFAFKYLWVILLLVILSILTGFIAALQPLVLAPALHIMEKTSPAAAQNLADLTLNNLGPSMLALFGMENATRDHLIVMVCGLYILMAILVASLNFGVYMLAIWLRSMIGRDVSVSLHAHMLALPLAFYNNQRAGDLISRFTNDVTSTAYFLDSVTRGILQSLTTIIICAVFLIRTNPTLASIAVGVGVLHFTITRLLTKQIRSHTNGQNIALGALSTYLQEFFLHIKMIKVYAIEKFEQTRMYEVSEHVRTRMLRLSLFRHFEEPLRITTNAIAIAVVVIFSFRAYDHGLLTVAGFALFLALTQRVIEPISLLFVHILATSGMFGCATRVLHLFQTPSGMTNGTETAAPPRHGLCVESMTFGYHPDRPILRGLELEILRGQTVAIVGSSGAGKSTLADLLLRLYDPIDGRVTLDGIDIRKFSLTSYRSLFGVVPQECLLYNASIRDNVSYGRPYDEDRFRRALALACAVDFVDKLPNGADSLVGDRGVRLSGGQRQRIALARAVYSQPPILILDEATSALDAESEQEVQHAIDNVLRQITAVVIAHRLTTILRADRIVVLENGAVAATGTHAQLLEESPLYQRLYRLHFADSSAEK
jgi:subfamily B ATP-binding cassette protein MsbA